MSTTWLSRLTSSHGHRPRLYFTIQGVPDVFQESADDVPSTLESASRPRRKIIHEDGISLSSSKMDTAARRIESGTLTIPMLDGDGVLAALFAPRKYRTTHVTANESASDVTINVKSTSNLDDLDTVYIDRETVTYTGTTSSSLTGCTRGAYGSVAAKHFTTGAGVTGASVFTAPPTWEGRRVYLYSYWLNDDGSTTTDLRRSEGVFRIERAPHQREDGVWVIQCSELSQEFYQLKIGEGLHDVDIDPVRATAGADEGTFDIVVGDDAIDQFVIGARKTYVVRTNVEDGRNCNPLEDVDSTIDTITVGAQMATNVPVPWGETKRVRHIAILEDTWAQIALEVLTSRLGDFQNGGFDQLPGKERTAFFGPSFRFGAGILLAEIDTAAFRAVGDLVRGRFVIDTEITVADFMFEFCAATGSVPYVTRAGLFSVRPISSQSNATVMTVDIDTLHDGTKIAVEYDESVISPRVDLLCNYDPLTHEYAGRINTYDSELAARFPAREKNTLEIQSKAIYVEGYPLGTLHSSTGEQSVPPSPGMLKTLATVENMLRQIQVSSGRGRAIVRAPRWHLDLLQLELGDLVQLSIPAPNLEGEESVNQLARLVEMGVDWDGAAVDAAFELVDQVFVFAPACLIASAAGAVLTLSTGTLEAYEPATPGRMFGDDWPVQIWDISAGTMVQRTIVAGSQTDTTVEVSSAPGFAIEAGVDLLRLDNQALALEEATSNDDGFDVQDFTFQMNEDEHDHITVAGTPTVPPISRWR